ncbi:hypothetical protein SUGI_0242880 [Cryptomeria japonica]|nr:hypothetical protein SUGI_0242880 [Cryptomeria japonica]
MTFKPCSMKYSEYTPCQDPVRSRKYSREKLMYRERHCPAKNDVLKCLIPAPPGYKIPFSWPRSRDYTWFANVPHRELTIEKAVQNWIQVEGAKFRFPGGGTMVPRGAHAYIDDINNLIPLTDGSIRTAIDTGCGETQLYCCTHKVPVCGDCICFPERSACEVRTYAEWMVDSSCSFLPKCSFCLQLLTRSRRSVTQLGCLYVLHNSCLLLLLKGSSSPTGYTCPSCKSQIWPTKKQFVSSGSSLANQLEELFAKSHIFMLDKNSLLPLASELLSNFSEQGFSQPRSEIRSTVFSLSSPLAEMYTDPKSQKAQQSYIPKDQNVLESGETLKSPRKTINIETPKVLNAKAENSQQIRKRINSKQAH